MSTSIHPEFQIEAAHLARTLFALDCKIKRVEEMNKEGGDQHATNAIIALEQKAYAELQGARMQPYFGRIDLREYRRGLRSYYLGRHGFEFNGSIVIDWRAPLARVFYSGKPGRVSFEAPEGTVGARLLLKRLFEIRAQRLLKLSDVFDARETTSPANHAIVDPDQYLKDVIEGKQSTQLREIVATIQREQDAIIRADWKQALIVQGTAGSGKTSVALHRLAYLLYPGLKTGIDPKRCVIFGPNRFFLGYIGNVLPSLGIEHIHQTTVSDWVRAEIGLSEWAMSDAVLDALLSDQPRETKLAPYLASRLKNSLAMGTLLERYIERRRIAQFPEQGFRFDGLGPLQVSVEVAKAKLQNLHEAFAQLPLARHRQRFFEQLSQLLTNEYDKAIGKSVAELAAPGDEWAQRADDLREQADRMEQLAQEVQTTEETALKDKGTPESLGLGAEGLREVASMYRQRSERIADAASSQRERVMDPIARRKAIEQLTRNAERQLRQVWAPVQLPSDYFQLLGDTVQLGELSWGLFKPAQLAQLHQAQPPTAQTIEQSDLAALHRLYVIYQGLDTPPLTILW